METCIDSVKRIVTWIFIAFGFSVAIRFLFLLDLNKRVYNHVPGDCRIVNKITNGSAGIELVDELGVAFITSGLAKVRGVQRVVGRIHMYNFTQNNRKFEANRIRIEGSEFDRRSFTPNGISSYVSNGRVTLYVINNRPGNHSVEVFSYDKDRNSLTHRKSIHDPTFTNPFDIAAVGPDRFFLTNYVYMDKRWAQLVELAFQTSFGSIVYYDGKKTSYLEKYFSTPSGLAVSKNKEYLYVGSLVNEIVRVYKLNKDMSASQRVEINLMSSPNKLFVDGEDTIWVALHPVLYKAHYHIQHPTDLSHRSPSQILRIRLQEDKMSWVITEPYANDGATIWGSSAVVFVKNEMLIGSLFGRLLHCDINNPQTV